MTLDTFWAIVWDYTDDTFICKWHGITHCLAMGALLETKTRCDHQQLLLTFIESLNNRLIWRHHMINPAA